MSSNSQKHSKSSTPTSADLPDWTWPDLIDFEYCLDRDKALSSQEVEVRDHQILEEWSRCEDTGSEIADPQKRSRLFRFWVEAQRGAIPSDQPMPGLIAWNSWKLLLKLLATLGLFLGGGLAARLLQYDGTQPVNVASFLGWLVLVQILLVVVALVVFLLRKSHVLQTEMTLAGGMVRWLWSWLTLRVAKPLLHKASADQRTRLESFLGNISSQQTVYGKTALWPLMASLQRFGVFFNLGALVTSIALIMFSDRAFGWQSALNVSSDQIHRIVETLAQPWSTIAPQAAGPSLEQVEGSKIILKDGIRQLSTQNLVAWWPFLCMALTVYGLLPRLALWIVASWQSRRSLRFLTFSHVACDRLYERLQGTHLSSSGQGNEAPRKMLPLDKSHLRHSGRTGESAAISETTVALASQEVMAGLDTSHFIEVVQDRFHWALGKSQIHCWPEETLARMDLMNRLSTLKSTEHPPCILCLEEAWQPPIAEKLGAIRDLRAAVGGSAKIIVALVGRPERQNVLTSAAPAQVEVWTRQVNALGDPQIRVEVLCP